jgi:hypothetical protein
LCTCTLRAFYVADCCPKAGFQSREEAYRSTELTTRAASTP